MYYYDSADGDCEQRTFTAEAWRFQSVEVEFERLKGFALGGPVAFGASVAAFSFANRHRRHDLIPKPQL